MKELKDMNEYLDDLNEKRKVNFRISLSFQYYLEAAIQRELQREDQAICIDDYFINLTIADQPYSESYDLMIEDIGDFLSGEIKCYISFASDSLIDVYVTADTPFQKIKPPRDILKLLTYEDTAAGLHLRDSRKKSYKMINLSGLDISEQEDISFLFAGCIHLSDLILPRNAFNVKIMTSLFEGCKKLRAIDLSGFDMNNVEEAGNMFHLCLLLKSIMWDPKEPSDDDYEISISDLESTIVCDPLFDKAWWFAKRVNQNPAGLLEKVYKISKDRAIRLVCGARFYEDMTIRECLNQTPQEQRLRKALCAGENKNTMILPADCCYCAFYEENYCSFDERYQTEKQRHDTCKHFCSSEFVDMYLRYEEEKDE